MADIFTTTCKGIKDKLINKSKIKANKKSIEAISQWDTGANMTNISQSVVQRLGLVPCGQVQAYTPSGCEIQRTFIVDIVLPNNFVITNLKVVESKIGEQGIDLLIGMDIISKGDFAISNHNGNTKFTFRIPSLMDFDFIKNSLLSPHVSTNTVGRNSKCPCGSGKKYKQCCGK